MTDPTEPTPKPSADDLAAALEWLHTLIATSARDWGTYWVDAWLWAVLCGWDCEQAEHGETCMHGALEEMAEQHGWDAATVAKARRYRAAVRTAATPSVGAGLPEAADRAAVLLEAADRIDATDLPDGYVDMFDNGAKWATALLRRMAAEARDTEPATTVAYSPDGRTLRCPACRPNPLGSDWRPLAADELEHGGICTACGVDVLIRRGADRG